MPIYGEETQVEKKQEKRGALGLGYGGYGGYGLGNSLIAGSTYGGNFRLKILDTRRFAPNFISIEKVTPFRFQVTDKVISVVLPRELPPRVTAFPHLPTATACP